MYYVILFVLWIWIFLHVTCKCFVYSSENKAFIHLIQSLNIFNGAKPRTIMKAFDTIVTPVMLHGCEIWTSYKFGHSLKYILGHTKSNMEKFHTRVCKNTLGVNRWANNVASRSELGRYPIAFLAICNTYVRVLLYLQILLETTLMYVRRVSTRGNIPCSKLAVYIQTEENTYINVCPKGLY